MLDFFVWVLNAARGDIIDELWTFLWADGQNRPELRRSASGRPRDGQVQHCIGLSQRRNVNGVLVRESAMFRCMYEEDAPVTSKGVRAFWGHT